MKVRFCLLSDTHGRLDPRILSVAADCDHIVHAGDLGNAAVLESLLATGRPVVAVRGNNDLKTKWPPADLDTLSNLPNHAVLDLPGGRLAVEHGHRANPVADRHARLRQRYPDVRAVVYGHSHRQTIDRQRRPWILNPGAAGRSRTFGGPSCLVLDASRTDWTVKEIRFPPD